MMPEEKKKEASEKETEAKEARKEPSKEEKKKEAILEEQLKAAKDEANTWKNKYYMAFADVDNLRKQNEKTYQEAMKYRAMGFVEKFLAPLDGFHIALSMGNPTPEVKNYLVGFEYIYRQFTSALEDEGVKEIDPRIGGDFDLNTMHAVDTKEMDGPANKVVSVLGKGYMLKDRLVRPAMVVVSKPKPQEEKPAAQPAEKAEMAAETKVEDNASAKKDA